MLSSFTYIATPLITTPSPSPTTLHIASSQNHAPQSPILSQETPSSFHTSGTIISLQNNANESPSIIYTKSLNQY